MGAGKGVGLGHSSELDVNETGIILVDVNKRKVCERASGEVVLNLFDPVVLRTTRG